MATLVALHRKCLPVILSVLAGLSLAACASIDPQKVFEKARQGVDSLAKLPTLDSLLNRAPVTTSFADATTEIAFLDTSIPEDAEGFPLAAVPRDAEGYYLLASGLYEVTAESYCIQAGTHGPATGDGYLYAPVRGPKADIVQSILRRSAAKPEIPQHEVQLLLWAIVVRTQLRNMPAERQRTAIALLTPKELFDLNGGALGLIPPQLLQRYLDRLPTELRRVFELEQQLRQRLTAATATYEEIEGIAVLAGLAPPGHVIRPTPRGRWSYHPDGYFVRFFPSGYQRTRMQVYIPPPITVERDEQGRVVAVDDGFLLRVETKYAATSRTGTPSGGVAAHPFKEVRVLARDSRLRAKTPDRTVTRRNKGSALVARDAAAPSEPAPPPTTFANRRERLVIASGQLAGIQTPSRQHLSTDRIAAVVNLKDYATAVRDALGKLSQKEAWAATAPSLIDRTAESELYAALSDKTAEQGRWRTSDTAETLALIPFDPAANVAVPANTSSQRLASGGVPAGRPGERWYETLPDCPCSWKNIPFGKNVPDKRGRVGTWKRATVFDGFLRFFFHPGAEQEARWVANGVPQGQQCTYKNGALITDGLAAGTPDFYAPGNAGWDHFNDDVIPFMGPFRWLLNDYTCELYFQLNPPNKGTGCRPHTVSPIDMNAARSASCFSVRF